ncbi:hypothetical protein [Litorivita sp. NS0012-18]|uniref:MotE family protein n=1 Tax=Litorivita sp. NS0012-18 TaxID=3127655 RepID=UPI003106C323
MRASKKAAKAAAKTAPKAGAKPKARKRRRTGRGTLLIIASLLIGSAMIRIGGDAGKAFAVENKKDAPTSDTLAATPAEGCAPSPDMAEMLKLFQTREERLKTREAQMQERMQALAVADEQIANKMAELTAAEAALRETLALADSAAETDITTLTAVYENMKPKDAAALFEEMDPDFAAGFLARMRPDAAAGIMTGLSPTAAYTISVVLAGRNANVPKQ